MLEDTKLSIQKWDNIRQHHTGKSIPNHCIPLILLDMELLFNINKRLFFSLKSKVDNIAEILPGCFSERAGGESPFIEPWVSYSCQSYFHII